VERTATAFRFPLPRTPVKAFSPLFFGLGFLALLVTGVCGDVGMNLSVGAASGLAALRVRRCGTEKCVRAS
jgi:hypothetical protein